MVNAPTPGSSPSRARAGEPLDDYLWEVLAALAWALGLGLFLISVVRTRPLESIGLDPSRQSAEHTTLWLAFKYPLLVAPIAVVLLIVSGRLGASLGLPGLFRNPPARDLAQEEARRLNKDYVRSRGAATAFLGAFGVTLLTEWAWSAIYFSEVFDNLSDMPKEPFKSPPWRSENWQWLLEWRFWQHNDVLEFLSLTCGPFLMLFIIAECFPSRSAPGIDRRGKEFLYEIGYFVLGMITAVFTTIVLAKIGSSFHDPVEAAWRRVYPLLSDLPVLLPSGGRFSLLKVGGLESGKDAVPVLASFTIFVLVSFLGYGMFNLLFRRSLSPGLAICLLLGFVVLVLAILTQLSTAGQLALLGIFLPVFVWTNGGRFKHRFPGMDYYYRKGNEVPLSQMLMQAAANRNVGLLNDKAVLMKWKAATGQARPKLVVVTTTGGAYTAAFWTTVVLEELSRCIDGKFANHIRIMTGASGGMVGAGYFVASLDDPRVNPKAGGVTSLMKEDTGLDSLTPVVRKMVLGDLPGILSPFHQSVDRGVVLERQWKALDRPFASLAMGEAQGWRPSLIVSPMVVESGRRLLISNLDLGRLAQTQTLGAAAAGAAARIFSRSAVEFFRVFVRANQTFNLQTAVRMSATFPFASPAVSLPTQSSRRVVDAGYYDNYGVDLATSWLYVNQGWLRANTSGVALIQLRAYPNEEQILSHFGVPGSDRRGVFSRLWQRLARCFQEISSPLAGGLSAREWSMRFRNAIQVRVIHDLLNRGKPNGFFETFIFENSTELAMNWFITDDDIANMRSSIGAPPPPPPPPPPPGPIRRPEPSPSVLSSPEQSTSSPPVTEDHVVQEVHDLFKSMNLTAKESLIAWWKIEQQLTESEPT